MSRLMTALGCALMSASLVVALLYAPHDTAEAAVALGLLAVLLGGSAACLVLAAALDPEERWRRHAQEYRRASLCRRLELPDERRRVLSFSARSVR